MFKKSIKVRDYKKEIGQKLINFVVADYIVGHYPNFTSFFTKKILKSFLKTDEEMTTKIGKIYLNEGLEKAKRVINEEIISKESDITKLLNYKSPQSVVKKFFLSGKKKK
jgi:dsRNA-specific ribonuclease